MKKNEDIAGSIPRTINSIFTMIDGMPDIIFESEKKPEIDPNHPHFMRRYTPQTLSNIFRAMGCNAPLNQSMADWIFNFLRNCPVEHVSIILGTNDSSSNRLQSTLSTNSISAPNPVVAKGNQQLPPNSNSNDFAANNNNNNNSSNDNNNNNNNNYPNVNSNNNYPNSNNSNNSVQNKQKSSNIFSNQRTYSRGYLVLTRLQFHRLVCAALHVHQFRKIRYCVDFRLVLDFTENRRFFIVLLSGAPGTGKSTIASLIASRMSVEHILSTDSIRHAMRTFYPANEYPILYKSTYECGDLVDPDHKMSEEERCVKGYLGQSNLVGDQLMNIISTFANSHTSLIIEGVHLNIDTMLKVVQSFPNVLPFLIYIKKEDFHKQRFAVRAKYMTTDPSANRYISNFSAIRFVQSYLSKGASQHLVPKIDNRNIDRSLETIHQTLFSYLKKLEGRNSMYDPATEKLTFLDSVWHRRKQKLTSKAKTLKIIRLLKSEIENIAQQSINESNNNNNDSNNENNNNNINDNNNNNSTNDNNNNNNKEAINSNADKSAGQNQNNNEDNGNLELQALLSYLPIEGSKVTNMDLDDGDIIQYLRNGTMLLTHKAPARNVGIIEKKAEKEETLQLKKEVKEIRKELEQELKEEMIEKGNTDKSTMNKSNVIIEEDLNDLMGDADGDFYGDTDTAEVTLTDFVETTDSEFIDLSSILNRIKKQ